MQVETRGMATKFQKILCLRNEGYNGIRLSTFVLHSLWDSIRFRDIVNNIKSGHISSASCCRCFSHNQIMRIELGKNNKTRLVNSEKSASSMCRSLFPCVRILKDVKDIISITRQVMRSCPHLPAAVSGQQTRD